MSSYTILINQAKCPLCYENIQSTYINSKKSCNCGNIFIDGGNSVLEVKWYKKMPINSGVIVFIPDGAEKIKFEIYLPRQNEHISEHLTVYT